MHVTHDPSRQCGAAAGQFTSIVQSTQPSAGSQTWLGPHWFVPFIPHTALPPMRPPLPPPQARKTNTKSQGNASEPARKVMIVRSSNNRAKRMSCEEPLETGPIPRAGGRPSDQVAYAQKRTDRLPRRILRSMRLASRLLGHTP
jgi:hypothetical protein